MGSMWALMLLGLVATVHTCTQEEFLACSAPLVYKYDLRIEDSAQVFPSLGAAELDQFCRDYAEYQECVSPVAEACESMPGLDIVTAVIDGENAAVKFACSPDGKQIYINEGLSKCFSSSTLKAKTEQCNRKLESMEEGEECSALNQIVTCVTDEVKDVCGNPAAKWTHEFNTRAVTPLANMIDCRVTSPLDPDEDWGRGSEEGDSWESDEYYGSHSGSHSRSHSGSHEHHHGHHGAGKLHRGLVIGLGCGAIGLFLLLAGLGGYMCYRTTRVARRQTDVARAAPYLEKSPVVITEGKSNPAYIISAPNCEEKSEPPPEYRSQVSLQGWVGEDDEKQPLPEADYSQA